MTERNADTVIVGGGISGACLLHRLSASGVNALLLERGPSLGGVICTRRMTDGALAEFGPNSAQLNPLLNRLIGELGLRDELMMASPEARNRYIVRNGKLHPLPMNPVAFFRSPLLSFTAKFRLFREPFVSAAAIDAEESVAQFVERRLGREPLDFLINPFVNGVYAGTPETLSVKYAFRRLHQAEQQHGSLAKGLYTSMRSAKKSRRGTGADAEPDRRGTFSFRQGLSALPATIEAKWRDRVMTDCTVATIRREGSRWSVRTDAGIIHAANLVIATEAYTAADLLNGIDPELAGMLRSVHYPPVAVCVGTYRRDAVKHPLDGFGMLIPGGEEQVILGTIFSSSLFPGRAPEGTVLLTSFVGGGRQQEQALKPQDEISGTVQAELAGLLGITQPALSSEVRVWTRAIPQYHLGYGRVLDAIDQAEERHPGLRLLGNYRTGVALGDCVAAAETMGKSLQTQPPLS